MFDPEFEYRSVLNEIAQLDQQITTGQALSYGETYQTELTARRAELQASLPGLGSAMLIHQRLSDRIGNRGSGLGVSNRRQRSRGVRVSHRQLGR